VILNVAPLAALRLGNMLTRRQGDLIGARAAYQQAIDSGHPDIAPQAQRDLGNLLMRERDSQRALSAYRQAMPPGHPDAAPEAANNLGNLLADLGRAGAAPQSAGRRAEGIRQVRGPGRTSRAASAATRAIMPRSAAQQ